jgi:hypothetical protein
MTLLITQRKDLRNNFTFNHLKIFPKNVKNGFLIGISNIINLLMKAGLLLALILILVSCDQLVPIQKNGYGFTIGDPYGKLHI